MNRKITINIYHYKEKNMNELNSINLIAKYSSLTKRDNNTYILIVSLQDKLNNNISIPILINQNLYELLLEYCIENNMLGIKGFISLCEDQIQIVGNKITLLSSKK